MQSLNGFVTTPTAGSTPFDVTILPGFERRIVLTVWATLLGGDVTSVTIGGKALSPITDGVTVAQQTGAGARLVRMYTLREVDYPSLGPQPVVVNFGAFPPNESAFHVTQLAGASQAVNVAHVAVASTSPGGHTFQQATLNAGAYTDGLFLAAIKQGSATAMTTAAFASMLAPFNANSSLTGSDTRTLGSRRTIAAPISTVQCNVEFSSSTASSIVAVRMASSLATPGGCALLDEG